MTIPKKIESCDELQSLIEEIGFIPYFKNAIAGFSVEEITVASHWFDGEEHDPWQWSRRIAQNRIVAYGKFFKKRAGFISKEWLPFFANARRDGYDFDSLFEDGKAPFEHKRIMDQFASDPVIPSYVLKQSAGFTQPGSGSFETAMAHLQMQTYLCICGFERKRNRRDEPYGWPVANYATPEYIFSDRAVTSRYDEDPKDSLLTIARQAKELLPMQDITTLKKYLS